MTRTGSRCGGHNTSGASSVPVQIGYRPHYLTPTNVDQHQPVSSQAVGHPGRRSAGQGSPSGATSANAARSKQNMPSPGGQISRMAIHKHGGAGPGVDRVWHPIDLPQGYHTTARGQSYPKIAAGRVEGCPRAAVWSGYARSTGCHTAPSVQDQWCGQTKIRPSPGRQTSGRGENRRELPRYISTAYRLFSR